MTKDDLEELRKEIVIARLRVLPSNRKVAIGNYGAFTKEELISHIEKNDEIGKIIVQVQMKFVTAMKEGKLYA